MQKRDRRLNQPLIKELLRTRTAHPEFFPHLVAGEELAAVEQRPAAFKRVGGRTVRLAERGLRRMASALFRDVSVGRIVRTQSRDVGVSRIMRAQLRNADPGLLVRAWLRNISVGRIMRVPLFRLIRFIVLIVAVVRIHWRQSIAGRRA